MPSLQLTELKENRVTPSTTTNPPQKAAESRGAITGSPMHGTGDRSHPTPMSQHGKQTSVGGSVAKGTIQIDEDPDADLERWLPQEAKLIEVEGYEPLEADTYLPYKIM